MKIIPFRSEHIEQAAALVAVQYQAERSHNHLFPARFEQADAIMPQLQGLAEKVPGVAAICHNRLIGFMLGFRASVFQRIRGVLSPDWGHATDGSDSHTIYRAMYAELSKTWIANGCFTHAIQLYAHERDAQETWFSLGFGIRGMDALRDLGPVKHSNVDIRRAEQDTIDALMPLEIELNRHLATSPIFLPLTSTFEETRTSRNTWLSDPKHALWLAYRNNGPVGFMCVEPSPQYGLPISDDMTISITGAFTKTTLRGHGVGTALLSQVLDWARENGYQKCAVDCETANIPGYAFWCRHFQPVGYSLVRCIDERLAWANEHREEPYLW